MSFADALDATRARIERFVDQRSLAVALTLWGLTIVVALFAIVVFDARPAETGHAPPMWPSSTSVHRAPGRYALVMTAHPRCACTRASLRELERLMARIGSQTDATVVFVGGVPAGGGDLHAAARGIAHVDVLDDVGRTEAKRFGAATSGSVALYDGEGHLVYEGGLTASRGHEGESVGAAAIRSRVLHADTRAASHASVFGCRLPRGGGT